MVCRIGRKVSRGDDKMSGCEKMAHVWWVVGGRESGREEGEGG